VDKIPISNPLLREAMLRAFRFRCFYTGRPVTREIMTIDHVVPKSRGGEDTVYNYVLTTREINKAKYNKTDDERTDGMLFIVKTVYAPRVLRYMEKELRKRAPREKIVRPSPAELRKRKSERKKELRKRNRERVRKFRKILAENGDRIISLEKSGRGDNSLRIILDNRNHVFYKNGVFTPLSQMIHETGILNFLNGGHRFVSALNHRPADDISAIMLCIPPACYAETEETAEACEELCVLSHELMGSNTVSRKTDTDKLHDQQMTAESNYLIEASYKLTVQEQRLILLMASMIRPTDTDFQRYRIGIREFNEIVGIRTESGYSRSHRLTDRLLGRRLCIRKPDSLFKTNWLCSAEHFEGYVELCFHPDLKAYLLQLKRYFTQYQLRNVIRLRSIYGIRIYELLKQYETVGKRTFDLEELRHVLGIDPDKYRLYGDFKRKVLKSAQKEVNGKTDLSFEFTEKKKGRKVAAITFTIRMSRDRAEREPPIPEIPNPEILVPKIPNPELYARLQEYFCLTPAQARKILSDYEEPYILENLAYVEERIKSGKVRNPGPYTLKALKEDFRQRKTRFDTEKDQKAAEEHLRHVRKEIESSFQHNYERYRLGEIKKFRESLPQAELERTENDIREQVDRKYKGNSPSVQRLNFRMTLNEYLTEQAGVLSFEEWKKEERKKYPRVFQE